MCSQGEAYVDECNEEDSWLKVDEYYERSCLEEEKEEVGDFKEQIKSLISNN